MKAILQQNPDFKFATNQLSLPGDWPAQMGSGASAVHSIGGPAPDTSTAPGIADYLKEMEAKAEGATLSDFSKLAWASFYAFAEVASTIEGDITAQTLTEALGQTTSIDTKGITPPVDFTKAIPVSGMTRVFTDEAFLIGADDGEQVQEGDLIDTSTYVPIS